MRRALSGLLRRMGRKDEARSEDEKADELAPALRVAARGAGT